MAAAQASAATGRRKSYGRYVLGKVAGAAGSLGVRPGARLLPLPGAAGRPGPDAGPRQVQDRGAARGVPGGLRPRPAAPPAVPHLPEEHLHRATSASRCRYRVPVSDLILDRLWPTLLLVGIATLLAALIGVYLGVISAWNRGKATDRITTGTTLTLYSMPEWWLGLLLIAGVRGRHGPAARDLPDRRPALGRRRARDPRLRRRHRARTWCCRCSPWSWSTSPTSR